MKLPKLEKSRDVCPFCLKKVHPETESSVSIGIDDNQDFQMAHLDCYQKASPEEIKLIQ